MYISWKMGAREIFFLEGRKEIIVLNVCWLHSFNVTCLTALGIWILHSLWKFIIMGGTECLYFLCVLGASLPATPSSQNCCLRSLCSRAELPWTAWRGSWSHPKPQLITMVAIDNSLSLCHSHRATCLSLPAGCWYYPCLPKQPKASPDVLKCPPGSKIAPGWEPLLCSVVAQYDETRMALKLEETI